MLSSFGLTSSLHSKIWCVYKHSFTSFDNFKRIGLWIKYCQYAQFLDEEILPVNFTNWNMFYFQAGKVFSEVGIIVASHLRNVTFCDTVWRGGVRNWPKSREVIYRRPFFLDRDSVLANLLQASSSRPEQKCEVLYRRRLRSLQVIMTSCLCN